MLETENTKEQLDDVAIKKKKKKKKEVFIFHFKIYTVVDDKLEFIHYV
jgi:hypothetical protein